MVLSVTLSSFLPAFPSCRWGKAHQSKLLDVLEPGIILGVLSVAEQLANLVLPLFKSTAIPHQVQMDRLACTLRQACCRWILSPPPLRTDHVASR